MDVWKNIFRNVKHNNIFKKTVSFNTKAKMFKITFNVNSKSKNNILVGKKSLLVTFTCETVPDLSTYQLSRR